MTWTQGDLRNGECPHRRSRILAWINRCECFPYGSLLALWCRLIGSRDV